jgi:hypothetical protein
MVCVFKRYDGIFYSQLLALQIVDGLFVRHRPGILLPESKLKVPMLGP